MSTSLFHPLGGLALGCLLVGSASAQNPVPAAESAAPSGASITPAPRDPAPQAAPAGDTVTSPDSSLVVIRFSPQRDRVAQHAADSLNLTAEQRKAFFETYAQGVALALRANPRSAQPAIDSVRTVLVTETGKKMRFVRHARLIFADMYARRSGDKTRAPGTEEELWRSSKNVENLIALYRDKPEATDSQLERAMSASFRR